MSIQTNIVLRHRAPSHVRFQIPELLCEKNIAIFLQQRISNIDTVYRVRVFRKQQKLSIHFVEENCSFQSLIQQLYDLLSDMKKKGQLESHQQAHPSKVKSSKIKEKVKGLKASLWVKEKYTETKDTAQAVSVLAKLGLKNKKGFLKDPEKSLIDFFNDVLVLYLIKTHWRIITQQWMLKPITHRYEWLASFYLMYLLIRSKMPKK